MSSIDQRIVQMQFDNKGFENGVSTTMKSLKTLNESLKMKSATNGLSEVDKSVKNLGITGLTGLGQGVEAITNKFSALQVVAVTALANITNSALNAGKSFVNSITLEPITTGFNEYEIKMNAIQTILTNTADKGTKLKDVTKALNELNDYADLTIYNFAEMTKNIGTFTAAGIDLDVAVNAIKGISNLGAGSGSSPQQVATAMYQLSQALSAGKVGLQDWNSVVNAGMGGALFQKALKETAKGMGKVVDAGKPFRETLQDGWLTSDVLIKTLDKFANDPSLVKAATEVKTFTGLIGTMQEAVQSGWAQSWEFILGNKQQAAELFTGINNAFGEIIAPGAEARNTMLEFWNEAGGRKDVIDGLKNILQSVGKGLGAIRDGFREVFPPMTGKQLVEFSKKFKDLTEKLKMGDGMAKLIKTAFKGFFSVIDLGLSSVSTLFKILSPGLKLFDIMADGAARVGASIGAFFTKVRAAAESAKIFDNIEKSAANMFKSMGNVFDGIYDAIGSIFVAMTKLDFDPLFKAVSNIAGDLGQGLGSILNSLAKGLGKLDFNKLIVAIGTIVGSKGLKSIKDIIEGVADSFQSLTKVPKEITGLLDTVKESLEAYQSDIKADILMKIAIAIGVLTLSLSILASIDREGLESALVGMTMLFAGLMASVKFLVMTTKNPAAAGSFWIITKGLSSIATAVLILSYALKNISKLSWEEIAKGLTGTIGLMIALAGTAKILGASKGRLMKGATGMLIMSAALHILVGVVKELGRLDINDLMKGLFGVGMLLTSLGIFMSLVNFNKMGPIKATGLLILAAALNSLSFTVDNLGRMDINQLVKGLIGIGALLTQLTIFVNLVGRGKGLISTAIGLTIMAGALSLMTKAVESMGNIPIEKITIGLLGIAGALTVMAVAAKLIPKGAMVTASIGVAAMSGALVILSFAMERIGNMSAKEIVKSLFGLAGALTILAVAMYAMSSGIAGAGAMMIMAAALAVLTPQLVILSTLELKSIGNALLALAGVFGIFAIATALLSPLAGPMVLVAGSIALLGLACLAAGAGVALFATGLATLAAVGAGGIFVITEAIRNLIDLLPHLGKKLAQGIVNFIAELVKGIPALMKVAGEFAVAFIDTITKYLPAIVESLVKLVAKFGEVLIKGIPTIIDVAVDLVIAVAQSIMNNLDKIVPAVLGIIIKFVEIIGNNIGRVIQAGIDLMVKFINGMAEGIRKNHAVVRTAIINLIQAIIEAMVGTFGWFISKGGEFVKKMAEGIRQTISTAINAGKEAVGGVVRGIQSKISELYNAGKELINGFIKGIQSKISGVWEAAKGIGSKAVEGIKSFLKINSPARAVIPLGKGTVEGFVAGITRNVKMSKDAARDLAEDTIDNMLKPINKLKNLIDGSIDVNPTITPIMDLSSIKNGTRTLGDMLSANDNFDLGLRTSGILGGSISQVQNGTSNKDVVSAIKDLKKTIKDVGGTTYNVNGITYDDNSIGDAIETLVNAAKIERRI